MSNREVLSVTPIPVACPRYKFALLHFSIPCLLIDEILLGLDFSFILIASLVQIVYF